MHKKNTESFRKIASKFKNTPNHFDSTSILPMIKPVRENWIGDYRDGILRPNTD